MKKVAIVGFGSIGQKHFRNFVELDSEVRVVSRRKQDTSIQSYPDLQSCIGEFSPEIVFICNETHLHAETLNLLKKQEFKGLIIVEKPISSEFTQLSIEDEYFKNLKVSYNLRFNPLLVQLKADLGLEVATSVVCYVGQYLPSWRPQTDYSQSYSAQKEKGGGVLLDLSHEIDYCQWLFGSYKGVFCRMGKLSNLDISSEDTASIQCVTDRALNLSLHLNYTDHITNRFLIVNTNSKSFKIDFINKTYQINDKVEKLTFDNNEPYLRLASDILKNNGQGLANYYDALETMFVIKKASDSMKESKWINL